MTARLDVIGLVVADLAASRTFYERLGLEFGRDFGGHVEATLPGGFRLTLDTEDNVRGFHPGWQGGAGRIGLAFGCDDPAAVDALYEELTGAGYHGELKPFDAVWGQRYATVHDPDGNGIDLYAALS
ncbi:VOC family protein [Nocardia terpenica]|uniref:VOC family protein n=1 Tax=Nocardia terpenica TaxID=455432 RepID=UPI0018940A06|nr:VOC family protein [Nocardia terpenica]MBF6063439.1 VOC family protein [Nocardia terpenica]MBF6105995.1 VOC family protein [Nocardia terpenica]MBF6113420.1 VOC family protein [Nocardia terpenica]MBF6119736.1 VOC family protein [Nocardia terpenica]MBF6152147.1 VOC family protein [Nocardia terpenica]